MKSNVPASGPLNDPVAHEPTTGSAMVRTPTVRDEAWAWGTAAVAVGRYHAGSGHGQIRAAWAAEGHL